jgi:tRNA nucleotidyltransferase (CCA-adding enzyme)
MPKFSPPPEVVHITRVLEQAGHEAWCVGGGVRDALLGIPNLDWDLATSATPQQVRKLFKRTVPVGIEFGTVGVLDDNNVMHEVTTFRRDVETDGRHAVVKFGASLDDDLARRDFTINAIAYSPTRDKIRDPFGGQVDLHAKIIRAVGVPHERMMEDRLRALRAIRFAARFEFEIEPVTWEAIRASAPYLTRLSAERVKQEIDKTMEQVRRPSRAFAMWKSSGAFDVLIPILSGITPVELRALDYLCLPNLPSRPQRKIARITALFCAASPTHRGGHSKHKHESGAESTSQRVKSAGTVLATLQALRYSNADIAWISRIVDLWHSMGREMKDTLMQPVAPTDATLRRWAGAAGRTRIAFLLRIANAFWWAEREAGKPAPSRERIASVLSG